uniref:zinc finger protein Xfin n=1 Tax=Solea senegalensis TaxID=28829 RepID=UPI001CD8897F|nr:zinc finger protein Xfin [Solea senegalensis]
MMLGLQGNTSSPKVYRCVACSATFTGLASLLVHQATHANAVTKVPTTSPQPVISPHETLFASMDSSVEHNSPPSFLTESSSPSFYICDCGEEFQDFSLMLEHKSSHVSQIRLLQPQDDNIDFSGGTGCDKFFPTQHVSLSPTVTQPGLDLCCPSTSRSPPVKSSSLTDHKADVTPGEEVAIVTTSQCTSQQEDVKKLDMSPTTETFPETVEGEYFKDKTISLPSNEKGTNLPKTNSIMKLLASAYMKCSSPSQPENNSDNIVTPKQEVVPVDITPGPKPEVSPVNDLSVVQMRRLLSKPGIKTKAPSISKILESSKKRVVSLTKTFSPVVVLETRQKLMDPVGNGVYGRYQCGRCRRVFPHLDRLTEHHFLHKKERIKCCRHCKQLIIGRVPLPDSHTCPQLGNRAIQPMRSCQKKLPFGQKIVPFHGLSSTKKVYFCPLCKHSYARRWNLKMHKCLGPGSALTQQAHPPIQNRLILTSNSTVKTDTQHNAESHFVKSVAVGTEVSGHIKVELMSQNSDQPAASKLAWNHPSKTFSPFDPKPMLEHNKDASVCGVSPQQGEEYSWNVAAVDDGEGQWTMPLDDEMEVFNSAGKAVEGGEVRRSASLQQAEMTSASLRYFVRDGVKWYPCNRCQKTYSQASTLRRHLRLCGFRPCAPGTAAQDAIPLNANHMKPVFACFVCGKTFNRKDNMTVHSKKCQLRQSMSDVDRRTMQQSESVSATDGLTQEDDGGHWGIMSLPSVLPRRVTCECGVGFTSPKLLLEHLQKHAQESYTCPTCGETVSSWADYEVHLQIHMHPHHQLLKGLQPSQPLLLRFQQQPPQQQQPPPPSAQQPTKQPRTEQFPNSTRKKQRIVCTRCGNTFASRCSLRRHVSWNRCKGPRIASVPTNPPKTHHCSQCNNDFPNSISLTFHQRSGTCKPAMKPVRCPVCLRWFSTVDGLQKHLLTHKRPEAHRCDICQGTYANIKSLKTHRRKIHRIMAGDKRQTQQVTS